MEKTYTQANNNENNKTRKEILQQSRKGKVKASIHEFKTKKKMNKNFKYSSRYFKNSTELERLKILTESTIKKYVKASER